MRSGRHGVARNPDVHNGCFDTLFQESIINANFMRRQASKLWKAYDVVIGGVQTIWMTQPLLGRASQRLKERLVHRYLPWERCTALVTT